MNWQSMASAPLDGNQFLVAKYRPSSNWRFSVAKLNHSGNGFITEADDVITRDDTAWLWTKLDWPTDGMK